MLTPSDTQRAREVGLQAAQARIQACQDLDPDCLPYSTAYTTSDFQKQFVSYPRRDAAFLAEIAWNACYHAWNEYRDERKNYRKPAQLKVEAAEPPQWKPMPDVPKVQTRYGFYRKFVDEPIIEKKLFAKDLFFDERAFGKLMDFVPFVQQRMAAILREQADKEVLASYPPPNQRKLIFYYPR